MSQMLDDYYALLIVWKSTIDPFVPFIAQGPNGESLHLKIGEFPDEDLWHLYCNDRRVGSFNNWPPAWQRPATTT